VTGVLVSPGAVINAGEALLTLDGRPVVALPGATPSWRDIHQGDEGADVLQLEQWLDSLGLDPGPVDGAFTFATRLALETWQADAGFPDDGIFRVDDGAFGHWPARIGRIKLTRGEFATAGALLFESTEAQASVLVTLTPTQRLQVAEGMKVNVEVTGSRVAVAGTLGAPREAVAPAQGQGEAVSFVAPVVFDTPPDLVDGAQVSASIVVEEVDDAIVVPLAAIVSAGDGQAAVQVQDANGSIRLAPVSAGAAEGAYVEITSGLRGDEVVLIEGPRER
jgi:peptidoglycan hydrolase-like protein with peptidoglycan-binding domain